MFQGTGSFAGKSLLTAAFCRILVQDGLKVAPFKAQNMSLNSFVTADGREMARAQVLQAQACRLEPEIRMSPVLLKPSSDVGAQVIIDGRPVADMLAREYHDYQSTAEAAAHAAYDSLASDYDAVVLEGAGSPGEVNLKKQDFVNMAMARHAGSPVLIVGDIDRGGVFASFVGTMAVLDAWEKELVGGFLVNKFRGDASLLTDAYDYMREHTGRDVLGTVPYMHDHGLPEEDGIEERSSWQGAADRELDVVVVELPHGSNMTDFDPLRLEPDVSLRLLRDPQHLGDPDLIIIPGSKNTISDLDALRGTGMASALQTLAEQGRAQIVGICGGYQMLGQSIQDPTHVESARAGSPGLGLLPLRTTMGQDKTLTQVSAVHRESGLIASGYEIHHGETVSDGLTTVFDRPELGAADCDGRVWGTYLHGVFDRDDFRRWFLDRIRVRKGLEAIGGVTASYDLDAGLDRVAGVVREHVELDRIYALMRL